MATRQDPGIYRRRVRTELRDARKQAGRSLQEAAQILDASVSKIVRIENGSVPISTPDLKALLEYYGVTDPKTDASLIAAARASRERPWWHKYREIVRSQLPQLLAYEGEASVIRTYSPYVITGLLQTTAYAREVRSQTISDAKKLALLVEFSTERRKILTLEDAPEARFIIDIAPLRRKVGGMTRGPKLMLEQLNHIRAVAKLPNIHIKILHDDAGAHPAMNGPFMLFDSPDEANRVLFIEGVMEDVLSHDDEALIRRFSLKFETLEKLALSEDDSAALLDEFIEEYAAAAAN